jgi:hypothetical protein
MIIGREAVPDWKILYQHLSAEGENTHRLPPTKLHIKTRLSFVMKVWTHVTHKEHF